MSDWYKSKAQVEEEAQLQRKRNRLQELQKKLDSTDHKTFSDYDSKENENVEEIKSKRREWRREMRALLDEGVGKNQEKENK